MKKHLIFYLLSLIFICSLPTRAVKKIEANPINVAVMLTQESDSSKIASTCDYYGYLHKPTQDGYTIFTHPNGAIIRIKFSDQKYPLIDVRTKSSSKEKDQILKNLNFKKKDKGYERKSVGNITRCDDGDHGSLIFSTSKVGRQ